MAYNLGERFQRPPKSYKLLDPGAYQITDDHKKVFKNKVPFLSKSPRNTQPGGRLWTHAIYDYDVPPKIHNITCLSSKRPRFPYEAFSKEDLEALLCRCGIQNSCECPTDEDNVNQEVICQGKVRKRIFKGSPPKCLMGEGLSIPSKRDNGFEILPDGSRKRLLDKVDDDGPPFYDPTVFESTAFYRGCKWSQWTSKRKSERVEEMPGPNAYCFEKIATDPEVCAEKFRSFRRKTSKQFRFIEMVQQRNIIEGRPGPATYNPQLPRGYEMQWLGPKTGRFSSSLSEQLPGPADHIVKRTFDQPDPPEKPCHAKLPEPSFFGIKAERFKPRREEGPSPATYFPQYAKCHFLHCPKVPFGSSSTRFKEIQLIDSDDESATMSNEPQNNDANKWSQSCPAPTWEFKSKTVRMKPLKKILNAPSPADFAQPRIKVDRVRQMQSISPFFTSEGRFQPWYDWMPVFGRVNTSGPCYYCLEKPKCYPAVKCGPLSRADRFPSNKNRNPPPNKYNVGNGIETILTTHNQKLRTNIEKQHTFIWEPPVEPRQLSYEEQETILLKKSIALLNTDVSDDKSIKSCSSMNSYHQPMDNKQPKLLRCFVYGSRTPHCI